MISILKYNSARNCIFNALEAVGKIKQINNLSYILSMNPIEQFQYYTREIKSRIAQKREKLRELSSQYFGLKVLVVRNLNQSYNLNWKLQNHSSVGAKENVIHLPFIIIATKDTSDIQKCLSREIIGTKATENKLRIKLQNEIDIFGDCDLLQFFNLHRVALANEEVPNELLQILEKGKKDT